MGPVCAKHYSHSFSSYHHSEAMTVFIVYSDIIGTLVLLLNKIHR